MTTADRADLCVAIAAARQTAEHLARSRAQLSASEGTAVAAGRGPGRLPAEPAAALADLDCVGDDSWWARATPHTIGRAYAEALSWQDSSARAADAEQLIRFRLHARYGIDTDLADGPPQLVRNQYERYLYERIVAKRRSVTAGAPRHTPWHGSSQEE